MRLDSGILKVCFVTYQTHLLALPSLLPPHTHTRRSEMVSAICCCPQVNACVNEVCVSVCAYVSVSKILHTGTFDSHPFSKMEAYE